MNATLTWTPGLGAMLHTVYFGDSFDDVDDAVAGGTLLTSVIYDPGPLGESVGLIVGGRDHTWPCQDIQCQYLLCLDAHPALDIINFAVLD